MLTFPSFTRGNLILDQIDHMIRVDWLSTEGAMVFIG